MEDQQFIAPAKINLGLEVVRKRPDGYHELNSIFARIAEPHDTVRVSDAEAFTLLSSDPALPVDESNLIQKAVRLFARATKTLVLPVRIVLEKNIPTGAGLGGGSSDAATALQICNSRAALQLSPEELQALGLQLGADVPFFLQESPVAIARGIGEELTPFKIKIPFFILIAKLVNCSVTTKEAYERLTFVPKETPMDYKDIFRNGFDIGIAQLHLRNDFELSVFKQYPEIEELKRSFLRLGALFASMSGSGSAVYGLFDDGTIAHNASEVLKREGAVTFVNPPTT